MKPSELVNRATNLIGTTVTAIAGFAFASEIFLEKDFGDKGDDIALLLLAIVAVVWYKRGVNRFQRTVMPVAFTVLGLLIKVAAIVVEFNDKESVGDDFGGVLVFVLGSLLVWWLYKKNNRGLVDNTPAQPQK